MGGLHNSIASARQALAPDVRHKAMDEHKRNELQRLAPKDSRPMGRTGGLRPLNSLDPMGLPIKSNAGGMLPAVRNFGSDTSNKDKNIWTGGKVGALVGQNRVPARLSELGEIPAPSSDSSTAGLSKKEKKKRKKEEKNRETKKRDRKNQGSLRAESSRRLGKQNARS